MVSKASVLNRKLLIKLPSYQTKLQKHAHKNVAVYMYKRDLLDNGEPITDGVKGFSSE